MNEVQQALVQLADIRSQVAASTRFRGFAPEAIHGAGLLTIGAAAAQAAWPETLASDPAHYVIFWAAVLASCAILIGSAALSRSRSLHGNLADTLFSESLRQIAPFVAVQAIIAVVICRFAPESIWLIPGIWQLLTGLIGFVAVSNLTRRVQWAATWYFCSGVTVLLFAGTGGSLSPWLMGIPFAVGHALIAGALLRPME